MMMMDMDRTGSLLSDLRIKLSCARCCQLPSESYSSAVCDHSFCSSCKDVILSSTRSECSQCNVPIWRDNLRLNLPLGNIVKEVRSLLNMVSVIEPDGVGKANITDCPSDGEETVDEDHPEQFPEDMQSPPLNASPSHSLNSLDIPLSFAGDSVDILNIRHQRIDASFNVLNLTESLTAVPLSGSVSSPVPISQELVPSQPGIVRFVLSGIDALQGKKIVDMCLSLGAAIALSDSEATHLIVSVDSNCRAKRTLKYVHALLRGAWIVTMEWVERSFHNDRWLNEAAFEVAGDSSSLDAYRIPERSRTSSQRIFAGLIFILDAGSNLPNLTQAINFAGGSILAMPTTAIPKCTQNVYLICQHDLPLQRAGYLYRTLQIAPISLAWIFDSCSRLQVLPITKYRLDVVQ
uniref:BRCT domain-containing protein n=1 Tax=Spongospora subterranea TaxID=70186 RepID=A0A0H5RA23_9EUKA|eukprot:CRZ10933.1 hypothetical protein [Spongospora subterranea]